MKVVIIGGVAGGASCAARLRRLDESADIVLLERGKYISYANCGLPYHIGDVIKSRESLLVMTPEMMRDRFNVDVRVENEALSIDRASKKIRIENKATGNIYEEDYDTLVISTGSSPIRPSIEGIDSDKIKTLWTVDDAVNIKSIAGSNISSATVVGGGFIGLEVMENLKHAGLDVTLVEAADQVMAPLDIEMSKLVSEHIIQNNVDVILGDGVDKFEDTPSGITTTLSSGKTINSDIVILAIGVRPNSQIAIDCGLTTNIKGGIVVDDHMRTDDESIYAIGDVIEVNDFVFNDPTMVPLAGPANKQGRLVADIIAGKDKKYNGTQGSSIAKIFDIAAASTGANEKSLRRHGLSKGKDYETVTITQNSHAGYYPGAIPMILKLIFAKDGSRIYGAQIVGVDGVDKRIDTIATSIRLGAKVSDLTELELAYAPPFSSAKDPVNMAGFMAENVIANMASFSEVDLKANHPDALLLDVREKPELMVYEIPGAINIPLGEIRNRINEIDKSKEIIVFCAIGVRAYNATRILYQAGYQNVKIYPGGVRMYETLYSSNDDSSSNTQIPVIDLSKESQPAQIPPTEANKITLDCIGLQCPGPIMKVYEKVTEISDGDVLEVHASDPGFVKDVASWCRRTGNTLISTNKTDSYYEAVLKKGLSDSDTPQSSDVSQAKADSSLAKQPDGKTIIVFDGDLDKVLASFIIANGAAAMGRPVTMFFTFWGLTALRKPNKVKVKKTLIEKMFGVMLPRGTKKLKLSNMNMAGMGSAMMKKIMKDKNVASLEELMQDAMKNGVKIIACTMSMDVMGIKPEELIDGIEYAGVGTYLGDAEESNVNLFI